MDGGTAAADGIRMRPSGSKKERTTSRCTPWPLPYGSGAAEILRRCKREFGSGGKGTSTGVRQLAAPLELALDGGKQGVDVLRDVLFPRDGVGEMEGVVIEKRP